MNCPHCHSASTRKNGYHRSGNRRHRCNDCGKTWTEDGNIQGSYPINDQPLTNAEKCKERRRRRAIDKLANVQPPTKAQKYNERRRRQKIDRLAENN